MIDYWLGIDSAITAKQVMQRLSEIEPDKYSSKAQRRIKDWRIARTNELIFGQPDPLISKIEVISENENSEATTAPG